MLKFFLPTFSLCYCLLYFTMQESCHNTKFKNKIVGHDLQENQTYDACFVNGSNYHSII